MSFIVVGTNHKYSPIVFRERIAFSRSRLKDALNFLRASRDIRGAIILSTCNRVEIYASSQEPQRAIRTIEDFISFYHELGRDIVSSFVYRYQDREAIEHLALVASGLDSLVLGETQILGQVKSAFLQAEEVGFVDRLLSAAVASSLSLAKTIHRETRISAGKVSVGSVAVDFIKQRLGNLEGRKILMIGVGKVTQLVLHYLKQEHPEVVFVANKTFAKAEELAQAIGARAVRFDNLSQLLSKADAVITATASPHFVIKKETLARAFSSQPSALSSRLLIIDLAMPRDVEPRVREINGVELFCLEELQTVIKRNERERQAEAKKARQIVAQASERLWREVTRLEPEPVPWP